MPFEYRLSITIARCIRINLMLQTQDLTTVTKRDQESRVCITRNILI